MPAREETYTVLFEQLGSPLVDVDLPRSHTFKTGQMAGSATLMNNLVDQLSSVADTIRSTLHTTLGMRQYAVFHVKRRWSGARVGMGALSVTAVERLWPDPLVTLKDEHVLTEGGLQEIGTASLSEVSLSYSQDDLIGVDFVSGETLFLLVDQMGSGIIRRAYIPADHPRQDRCDQLDRRISKKTSPIGWVVPLRRVDLPPLVVGVAA
jgi:hypothetical protein